MFFPVIVHLGFDPVWFGIIIVCVVEIGLISPPVGMNMFVLKTLLPEVLDGDRLPRRDAVHVGRRHPPRHPRRLPHHLALAAEHDAIAPPSGGPVLPSGHARSDGHAAARRHREIDMIDKFSTVHAGHVDLGRA